MSIESTVKFYKVVKCGYYARGRAHPEFGSLDDTLDGVLDWVSQLDLKDTATFGDFDINHAQEDRMIYCFDITKHRSAKSFLVTLWNAAPTHNGNMPCADGSSSVGSVTVTAVPTPRNSIPGHPSYYWIIPELSRIGAIKLDGLLSSKSSLDTYLHNYMTFLPPFGITTEDQEDDHVITGYMDENGVAHKLSPQFKFKQETLKSDIDLIRQLRTDINKILRRTTVPLRTNNQNELNIWQQLSRSIFGGTVDGEPSNDKISFRYEINYTPSEGELEHLIAEFAEQGNGSSDVGFVFKGESSPRWLSKSLAKAEEELNIRPRADGMVVDARQLLNELERKRDSIFSQLERDE